MDPRMNRRGPPGNLAQDSLYSGGESDCPPIPSGFEEMAAQAAHSAATAAAQQHWDWDDGAHNSPSADSDDSSDWTSNGTSSDEESGGQLPWAVPVSNQGGGGHVAPHAAGDGNMWGALPPSPMSSTSSDSGVETEVYFPHNSGSGHDSDGREEMWDAPNPADLLPMHHDPMAKDEMDVLRMAGVPGLLPEIKHEPQMQIRRPGVGVNSNPPIVLQQGHLPWQAPRLSAFGQVAPMGFTVQAQAPAPMPPRQQTVPHPPPVMAPAPAPGPPTSPPPAQEAHHHDDASAPNPPVTGSGQLCKSPAQSPVACDA